MINKVELQSDSDFKAVKARLRTISELRIPGSVLLDNEKLTIYIHNTLCTFIESFPKREEQIKACLEAQDYQTLSKVLADLCYRLKTIHASDLANDCQKQMDGLPDIRREKVEAYMTFFLTAVSMLSIDVQMVVYKTPDTADEADMDAEETITESRCILAVDDEPFFLHTLEKALQDTQYQLICVNSGMSALRFLQNHRPDLFVLDIEMPEMDGYELARKIREAGQNAPILFLTSNAKREYVAEAIKMGAADFILKPINREYVLKRIGRFI